MSDSQQVEVLYPDRWSRRVSEAQGRRREVLFGDSVDQGPNLRRDAGPETGLRNTDAIRPNRRQRTRTHTFVTQKARQRLPASILC